MNEKLASDMNEKLASITAREVALAEGQAALAEEKAALAEGQAALAEEKASLDAAQNEMTKIMYRQISKLHTSLGNMLEELSD